MPRVKPKRDPVPLNVTHDLAQHRTIRERLAHLLTLDVWPRSATELHDILFCDRQALKVPPTQALEDGRLTRVPGLKLQVYAPAGLTIPEPLLDSYRD